MKLDVTLETPHYLAQFDSSAGAVCYRLFHKPSGSDILRTPDSEEMLETNRFLFGNPILFPPNRVRGGVFTFDGHEYRLPVNEPDTGCHLHGALNRMPFVTEKVTSTEASFLYQAKESEYIGFPHAFCVRRSYALSDSSGLKEITEILNNSEQTMPVMLGFHTTFRIPFCESSCAEDCSLTLLVQRLHKRDEHYLPTCEYEFNSECEALLTGHYVPAAHAVSSFFKANGNTARLYDRKKQISLEYRTEGFGYWMLYNGGNSDFLSVEPQTCAIDAFHIDQNIEQAGVISLPPHQTISFTTAISIV